jgi:hypothetical protein
LAKEQQELINQFRSEKIIVPVADMCKFKIGYVVPTKSIFISILTPETITVFLSIILSLQSLMPKN